MIARLKQENQMLLDSQQKREEVSYAEFYGSESLALLALTHLSYCTRESQHITVHFRLSNAQKCFNVKIESAFRQCKLKGIYKSTLSPLKKYYGAKIY